MIRWLILHFTGEIIGEAGTYTPSDVIVDMAALFTAAAITIPAIDFLLRLA